MRNLGQVVKSVQGLLGDPNGDWANRDYLVPFIDMAYGLIVLNLKNATSLVLQQIVPLLNVDAGTTDLYRFQVPAADANGDVNLPLLGLTDPLQVSVKLAGQPPSFYVPAMKKTNLPHVDPNTTGASLSLASVWWSWAGNRLRLSPVGMALDIEVVGRFNPPALQEDADRLQAHEDIWMPTTLKAAALAGVERTNPSILEGYAIQCTAAEDNIIADLIRQKQGDPKRFLKVSRSTGSPVWFWGK